MDNALQWAQLNGIILLMRSNQTGIYHSLISLLYLYVLGSFAYCYHSGNEAASVLYYHLSRNYLKIVLVLPDSNRLSQLCFSGSCDPSNFWREVSDVVLLLLQGRLRHEDGEVAVLDAQLLDLAVEKRLKKN